MNGELSLTNKSNISLFLLFSLLLLSLIACTDKKSNKALDNKITIMAVKATREQTELHFTGTIAPKAIVNVASMIDGEVKQRYFTFGQEVKQGDLLLTIRSNKLTKDYQDALSSYLKQKEEYHAQEASWQGTQELHKLGLVAEEKFNTEQRGFYEKRFDYYQKRNDLKSILERTSSQATKVIKDLEDLTFSDVDKLNDLLKQAHNKMKIYAPVSGTILFPVEDGEAKKNKLLLEGDPIKDKDILCSIGDLSGFSLSVTVNEMNILKLKLGQRVKITGNAFPSLQLKGSVDGLDTQANKGRGGLPEFNVHISVPQVSEEQRKFILIGMSSDITIRIESPAEIHIPLKAIIQKDGKHWVKRINKDGSEQLVSVEPGQTTFDSVAILHGLMVGDNIVVPD